jgi:hypothetical protein
MTTCAAALSSVRVITSVTPAVAPSMAQALARVSPVASRARRGARVLRTRARDPPRAVRSGSPAPPAPGDAADADDPDAPRLSRRRAVALGGSLALALAAPAACRPPSALAVDLSAYLVERGDASLDVVPPPDLDALLSDPGSGWEALASGVAFRVDRVGEGNVERGILDTVDHYVPNPFVEVRFTAYTASDGRAFASTSAARRPYNFQAGVKDEVQDEPGGVSGMRVGERRRFIVPAELCFKRRVFGQPPRDDAVLIDVELLNIQPY